uniref:Uncharacterized protein n=1 Tax=Arundo donax TaxID=35708 RepID=A0A0A9TJP5_ARUDO
MNLEKDYSDLYRISYLHNHFATKEQGLTSSRYLMKISFLSRFIVT